MLHARILRCFPVLLLCSLGCWVGPATRAQPAIATGPAYVTVNAFPNLTFEDPTVLLIQPGSNLFVVGGRQGQVWSFVNSAATSTKTLMLDLSAHTQGWSDSGILGIVFHPQFGQAGSANRGYVYIYYCYTPGPLVGSAAAPPNHTTPIYDRLSRFTIPDGSTTIDPSSELVLINQFDRDLWHNGGCMFFGADGFLYVSNGDEGGVNDQYAQTQKINSGLFSGVLRIDVDMNPTLSHAIRRQPQDGGPPPSGWPSSSTANYFIPNDNPFVNPNGSVLEEFWAIGFRSPHRMSYDAATGQIWLADVGQDKYEEVDYVTKGGNYEWSFMEGFYPGPTAKPAVLIGIDSPPILDYPHLEGNGCVIGGPIYRGTKFSAAFGGQYLFGDYNSNRIWAMTPTTSGTPTVTYVASLPYPIQGEGGLTTFGVDSNNELYFCTLGPTASIYTLAAPGSAGRLMNLSVKADPGAGGVLTAGFVLGSGTGTRPLLIRGVGPTLTTFGVTDAMADPQLYLISSAGAILASNDNWSAAANAAAISTAATAVGAFALPANSLDSAVLVALPAGQQSAQVSSTTGAAGVALAEVYDASASTSVSGPPLINLSALAQISAGSSASLTAGFVVGGNAPLTLLIRGVGPGLASFGIKTAIASPQLTLYTAASATIATNAGWGSLSGSAIATTAANVGAFPLTAGSLDSALLITLAPGSYTASVISADGSAGMALIEIYTVQ
jgi:glucose/arabinose dehydrogenase